MLLRVLATWMLVLLWMPGASAQIPGMEGLLSGSDGDSNGSSPENAGGGKGSDDPTEMYSEAYFNLEVLNVGLPPLDDPPDLETPQSSLDNFERSCRERNYERAARSLNLNAFPPEKQAEIGPKLAEQLMFILGQRIWINWDEIPTRPDGQLFGYSLKEKAKEDGNGPQRAIEIGRIHHAGRPVSIWLQRVKTPNEPPVWVIARQSVAAIPDLHEAYGPSPLQERMPSKLRDPRVVGIAPWQWIGIVLLLVVGGFLGWAYQRLLELILRRSPSNWATMLARSVRGPVMVIVTLVIFHLVASDTLRLAGPVMSTIEPFVFVLIVLAITWLLQRLVEYASVQITQRCAGCEDASTRQALLTRVTVAKHALTTVVVLVGGFFALSRFEWFQAIGYTMLASAGIAALIVGLAAQRSLGNLFAGIQLAITQPVRVGDAVLFEGEWGWIEEIAITYVVIQTWDLRRLVIPTAHLIDNPIQNWTRNGENLMKPVYLYADYRVDVDAVREELQRILESSESWDHEVPPVLQVTSCTEHTVELRALCSAADPPTGWDLHCEVRERLVAFLQQFEDGRYLPRTRVTLLEGRDGDKSASDGQQSQDSAPNNKRRRRRGGRRNKSKNRNPVPIGGPPDQGNNEGGNEGGEGR